MLRKVGKGRVFYPGQVRTMDVKEGDRYATKEEIDAKKNMDKLEKKMEGMGVTITKRKPLKFKL